MLKQYLKKSNKIWCGVAGMVLCIIPFMLMGKSDAAIFFKWQVYMMVFSLASLPLAKVLFGNCRHLLPFAKTLGFIIPGFMMWMIGVVFHVPFNRVFCVVIFGMYILLNVGIATKQKSRDWDSDLKTCMKYEILFFIIFLFWTYLIGFNPSAYGTEKFMDYAFLQKMLTTTALPPDDMWFAGKSINYYYGGQYYAAFIAKLIGGTAGKAEYAYNMMRAVIPAIMFVGVFGITRQMLEGKAQGNNTKRVWLFSFLSAMVSVFAGNGHYIIYGLLKPIFDISGDTYWFPDATRYIGYNPVVENDQTIHEFPCYSFVLGDLHAHMINIMMVLLIVALLYSFVKEKQSSASSMDGKPRPIFSCPSVLRYIDVYGESETPSTLCAPASPSLAVLRTGEGERMLAASYKKLASCPQIYMLGIAWGICNFTNYWDYIIYFVVIAITIVFTNILDIESSRKTRVYKCIVQILIVATVGIATALPFTMHFDSVFDGVGIAQNHSRIYQLAVLWGIPFVAAIAFICISISSLLKQQPKQKTTRILASIRNGEADSCINDLFAFILVCCAMGLVLIPEFVYVRDIYEATHARANTMFKLTYQAFILFGICSGYILYVLTQQTKTKILGYALTILYLLTVLYFFNAAGSWFGNWVNPSERIGTYALNYLDTDEFSSEKDALLWLKREAEKEETTEAVAEAPGDSYTAYERVSTITGLSTPAGWQVHEWLWRDSYDAIHDRAEDVDSLYTGNKKTAEKIINKYNIKYVFFGLREEEKYGEEAKQKVKELGKVVYEKDSAFIVEVK